jgi:hypothetical protein
MLLILIALLLPNPAAADYYPGKDFYDHLSQYLIMRNRGGSRAKYITQNDEIFIAERDVIQLDTLKIFHGYIRGIIDGWRHCDGAHGKEDLNIEYDDVVRKLYKRLARMDSEKRERLLQNVNGSKLIINFLKTTYGDSTESQSVSKKNN